MYLMYDVLQLRKAPWDMFCLQSVKIGGGFQNDPDFLIIERIYLTRNFFSLKPSPIIGLIINIHLRAFGTYKPSEKPRF